MFNSFHFVKQTPSNYDFQHLRLVFRGANRQKRIKLDKTLDLANSNQYLWKKIVLILILG